MSHNDFLNLAYTFVICGGIFLIGKIIDWVTEWINIR